MSKWNRVRDSFKRAHSDLFETNRYSAEFFNHTTGTYNPDTGDMEGQTRSSIGSTHVEIVPPAMDSTVDVDGTSLSWTTSIRFPEDDALVNQFVPLGEDSEKPTEVEISDEKTGSDETYELHGYSTEKGSGMVMCRLVE